MINVSPLYIKYSQYRKPEFQVKTEIIKEDGTLFVLKSACTKESEIFIQNWNNIYKKLIKTKLPLVICPMTPIDENTLKFDYIMGTPLIKELEEATKKSSVGECLKVFEKLEQILEDFESTTMELDTNFSKVFGNYSLDAKYICIKPGILDLNLDNIIIDNKGRNVLIDFEWTFFFPIPKRYILYRAIYYSFLHMKDILSNTLSLESVEKIFNFSNSEIRTFLNWETNFQEYVTGNKIDLEELIASRKNFSDSIKNNDTVIIKQDEIDNLIIPLEESLKATQEELKTTQEELKTTQEELKTTQEELKTTQEELKTTQEELKTTKEELKASQEELQNIYSSKSWKLTQPIREITKKIKDLNK